MYPVSKDQNLDDWSPLFEPPIDHQFYHEKRSSIVIGETEDVVCDPNTDRKGRPLPPIVIKNPSDRAEVRRARNTEAARRSRAKKNERIRELESTVEYLREKNRLLEEQNVFLRQKLSERQ